MLTLQNTALAHKMIQCSTVQSASMQINKSKQQLSIIQPPKCLLNLLEFNFLTQIIRLKSGAKSVKSFIKFQLILYLKTIDSIMELILLTMICICHTNFIQIKLDTLSLHKIHQLLRKMFLIKILKIEYRMPLLHYKIKVRPIQLNLKFK